MKKKCFRISLLGLMFLFSLGWLPLFGLYFSAGIKLSDDPVEEHLPKGLSRVVYSYFDPAMADEIAKISFHQSKHESINVLGFSAGGIYDPVMERIALAARLSGDPIIVHEILHHVWFQNLVPEQDSFDADFQRLKSDERYRGVAMQAQNCWDQAQANGEFAVLRLTELYCYLGDALASRRNNDNDNDLSRGLPEYMARHYRGVLQADMLFDPMPYLREPRIAWSSLTAVYTETSVPMRVGGPFAEIEALYYRGGVVGWNISRHHLNVMRVGVSPAMSGSCQNSLPPGLPPAEVHIPILTRDPYAVVEFYRRENNGFRVIAQATYAQASEPGWLVYKTSWPAVAEIRAAYLAGDLRVVPAQPISVTRPR